MFFDGKEVDSDGRFVRGKLTLKQKFLVVESYVWAVNEICKN